MWFVITIILSFHGTDEQLHREYQAEMFKDTWECHEYIAEHKVELLTNIVKNNFIVYYLSNKETKYSASMTTKGFDLFLLITTTGSYLPEFSEACS